MNGNPSHAATEKHSRRQFLKRSTAGVVGASIAGSLGIPRSSRAAPQDLRPRGNVNWQKHKAIVFENDDWCGNGRFTSGPRETYEKCDRGCSAAYQRIVKSWKCNMPAVVGGHRINYCSLDPKQVKEGYAQTERLLTTISKEHPDAVYLTSAEVGQLYRMGASVLRQGQRITCRNYTETETTIEAPNPGTAAKYIARNLRTDARIACDCDDQTIRFLAPVGEYAIEKA